MKKKILIILSLCVLFLVLCFLCLNVWIGRHTYDGYGMANGAAIASLTYTYGPDEYGQCKSILMHSGSISCSNSGGTAGKDSGETWECDAEFEQSLENIITEYGLKTWTDLPASNLIIDDGPTTMLKIVFVDGTVVTLGDAYEMPENGWEAVNEIMNLFED